MVCCSIVSVQSGAAIASRLFDRIGAPGTVMLRQVISAAILLAIARPTVRGRARTDWAVTIGFGAALAAMNLCFYEAVDRLPLGLAVTVELLGPLGLAVALSRRVRELLWVGLAIVGVVLLGEGGDGVSVAGVLFALGAAACWAAYILLSSSAGRRSQGLEGLALAMACGAVFTTPLGIVTGGTALLEPTTVLIGAGVAVLSGVVPYSLEIMALRRISARSFGVLMSLSPVAASLAGLILLGQRLGGAQVVAIACVIIASAGSVTGSRRNDPHHDESRAAPKDRPALH